ncbi:MAG: excinuclease ABC subunit UvrA, partial [Polyangiaceae bacterium]|nr:excinuclease ABC subunit UvrA [Polyangiaceae bacterium]
MEHLVVKNARQHNLKGVSCEIPRGKLVVITGPSGSGKSSLAFDTIYAEGQRRYVESLSAYARQFLEQLAKPDVELITGLSPAIAIEQRALGKSPRSTVGTVTEIADYLRLAFARAGTPHCPSCGARIAAQTAEEIVDRIMSRGAGARLAVLAPIARGRRGELRLELDRLRREGFVRARIDGQLVDLGDELVLDKSRAHELEVVVDRVVLKDGLQARVTDSVELALKLGEGVLYVLEEGAGEPEVLSERFSCVACGVSLPPVEPRLFSFNGPHGACPACGGLGERRVIDRERCVGSPTLTLREGVVLGWGRRGSVAYATELSRAVEALGVAPDVPWRELPEAQRAALLDGAPARRGKRAYAGLIDRLTQRLDGEVAESEGDDDDDADDDVGRFAVVRTCGDCGGKRLRKEALAVRLGGRSISDLGALPLGALRDFLRDLAASDELSVQARKVAGPLLAAVVTRLGFLLEVGLDYLSL